MANENEKKPDDTAKAEKAAKAEKNKKAGEAKKGKKGDSGQGVRLAAPGETKVSGILAPRLETVYKKEVLPALMKQFNEKNPMAIARLSKIVINCAIKDAVANPKVLDVAMDEMTAITGQKPVLTRSRKAIASF